MKKALKRNNRVCAFVTVMNMLSGYHFVLTVCSIFYSNKLQYHYHYIFFVVHNLHKSNIKMQKKKELPSTFGLLDTQSVTQCVFACAAE